MRFGQSLQYTAANGEGLELYRKLCRYLYSINPERAAAYVRFWREAWDEDEERFGLKN